MSLTVSEIRNAHPSTKDYYISDGGGLYLRVSKTGRKSWIVRLQRKDGEQKKTLGDWPDVSITTAREKLQEMKRAHRETGSIDPQHRATSTLSLKTVSEYVEDYKESMKKLLDRSNLRLSTFKKNTYLLDRFIVPHLGHLLPEKVDRRIAVKLIENHVNAPGTAGEVAKVASGFFNWLTERYIVQYNPFARMMSAVREIRSTPRERALKDNEIKKFWNILTDPNANKVTLPSRKALLLILITAQRPGEVAGMDTSEIDNDWWTIPPERTKNNKESNVYLTTLAKSMITPHHPTGPVFLSYQDPLNPKSILRNSLSQFVRRHPVLRQMSFTPHDLRRTAATGLSRLGCSDEIIDAILNHTKKGTIAIYNRHKYDAEKQEWLQKWSDELERLCL